MLALSQIVVATDFSATSMMALRHALGIARRYRSSVCMLHVVDPSIYGWVGPDGTSADVDVTLRDCEAMQAGLRREGMLEGVSFTFAVSVGPVWETIKETIEEKSSDLVVLGTHGRGGVSKLVLGSVAESAFKETPCPVMTVGPEVRRSKAAGAESKHFLVPTDISPESMDALPYGISLAEATSGDVTLLHVESLASHGNENSELQARIGEFLRQQAVPENMVTVRVEHGSPAEVIIRFADQHETDIIVMGLRAWTPNGPGMWHAAYKVVTHATCPVLSMRTPASLDREA